VNKYVSYGRYFSCGGRADRGRLDTCLS